MKNPKVFPLCLLAAALTPRAISSPLWAQDAAPVTATQEDVAPQWKAFRIKNVSPNEMASWFTPVPKMPLRPTFMPKVEVPIPYKFPPTWATGRSASEIAEFLALPAGVQTVASVEAQNVLWVLGTPNGLQKIAEKIDLLDRPLRQVEVEARVVQISPADAKTLGINFVRKEGRIEVGMANADIEAKIEALVAQKKAKIITAPRVTAIFGLRSSLESQTIVTTLVTIKNENGNVRIREWTKQDQPDEQVGLPISTTIGLSVTPTLRVCAQREQ
ncbi:MAG TPA: hypothetical protein VF627_04140 [Abditibacterium sp.]|jgi:hypothetical protein